MLRKIISRLRRRKFEVLYDITLDYRSVNCGKTQTRKKFFKNNSVFQRFVDQLNKRNDVSIIHIKQNY